MTYLGLFCAGEHHRRGGHQQSVPLPGEIRYQYREYRYTHFSISSLSITIPDFFHLLWWIRFWNARSGFYLFKKLIWKLSGRLYAKELKIFKILRASCSFHGKLCNYFVKFD